MSNGSLHLGRYVGIPVRAHWSMALIAVLFGVSLAGTFGLVAGIIAVVAFLLSILAHEFGHALVARRYGVETESIDLWALGGVARLDREPPTPRADGLIAVAGPLVSLAIGVVDARYRRPGLVRRRGLGRRRQPAPGRVQHAPRSAARRWSRAACDPLVPHRQQVPSDA